MGIITFLKELRKKLLVKKLKKLKELAKNYSSYIDSYNNSIESIHSKLNANTSLKTSYFLNSSFSSYCYSDVLTEKYDSYSYYSSLYDRTATKIERLENKLNSLN